MAVALALTWAVSVTAARRLLDLRIYDALLSRENTRSMPDVVVVLIDDASRKRLTAPLVMWEGYFAEVVRAAGKSGARSVALDVVFALPDEVADAAGRRQLAQAMLETSSAGVPVVLAVDADAGTPENRLYTVAAAMGMLGAIDLDADEDETVRRATICRGSPSGAVYTLGAAAAGMTDERCAFTEKRLIPFPDPSRISRMSLVEVLQRSRVNDARLAKDLKGKAVLIGTDDIQDLHATPVARGRQRQPGVEIHAAVAQMLLRGETMREASATSVLLLALVASALVVFAALRWSFAMAAAGAFATVALVAGDSLWSWSRGLWQTPVAPMAGVIIGYGAGTLQRYRADAKEKAQLRRHFTRYVPDAVIDELMDSRPLSLEGKRRPVAVLFSDIRGFTTLTEKSDPEPLVRQLNEYLGAMTNVIMDNRGTVDKFIGDGILAFFGAPLPTPEPAWHAVLAANAMLRSLEELNARWSAEGKPRFAIGIGLHFGEAIVGNIGCERKLDYTVIGDTVNTASRIESATKESIARHGVHVLVSGALVAELERSGRRVYVETMGEQVLKGKEQATALYLLRSIGEPPSVEAVRA